MYSLLLFMVLAPTQYGVNRLDEKPKEGPMKAKMVQFSGKVQGVGFRAAVAKIARDFPVTGWVKNLPDGRVQMVVEGTDENIKKFRQAIRDRWKDNIEKEQDEEREATGKFKSFEVMR